MEFRIIRAEDISVDEIHLQSRAEIHYVMLVEFYYQTTENIARIVGKHFKDFKQFIVEIFGRVVTYEEATLFGFTGITLTTEEAQEASIAKQLDGKIWRFLVMKTGIIRRKF